ncbi:hypothetical protein IAD21_04417 [Abditibacteriota bacterium]|nr:hypothetical protein IAD21_04417 [Abditibacteriota bacterium]
MNILQNRIQHLLDQLVAEGTERGVQVALYLHGQLVVDAYAGVVNANTGEKVTNETLFPVFSTTKGMTATIIHRLVERGLFDYETPIASLWPEFAAHGKEGITIRHALNHTSGLPLMPLDVGREELNDWATTCQKIADLAPVSAPGERTEYHAITYGFILGEAACRVTGQTFPQLWHDELVAPLESNPRCSVDSPRPSIPPSHGLKNQTLLNLNRLSSPLPKPSHSGCGRFPSG